MTTENWISIAGATIAFLSFLASLWQARLAYKSQESSADAASRSVTAAEEASASQDRIAKVLEKMESKYSNPWQVRHFNGDRYVLQNISDEETLDVQFATDSPMRPGEVHKHECLYPGDEVTFMYAPAMGRDRRIVVQWTRPSESEPRTWNGHVPPRPPR